MHVAVSSPRRMRCLSIIVVIMGMVAFVKRVLKLVRRGGAVLAVRVRANQQLVAIPQLVRGQQPVLGSRWMKEEGIRWKFNFTEEEGACEQRHVRIQ